jgi:hypothetical protein
MGLFSKKEKAEQKEVKEPKAPKEPKVKSSKPTYKVKNDPSKGASFWVVEIKGGAETILFSGTIGDCRDYIYLASRNLIL